MKDARQMGSVLDLTKQHLLAKYAPSGRHISRASKHGFILTKHYNNVQMYKFA